MKSLPTALKGLQQKIDGHRAAQVRKHSRHRDAMHDIPETVYEYWLRTAHLEFRDIPKSRFFFDSAADGLLTFFACVRDSGKPCGLPSAAADSVWHAWAARAPAGLERFCLKHFGMVIPHLEADAMEGQMEGALATCMVQARLQERRDPVLPSVPDLFALDRRLRMPRGHCYDLSSGTVFVRRLDLAGKPLGQWRMQKGLAAAQLLGAGLITQAHFDKSSKHHAATGGSCGSGGTGSSDCDGGSNGGDGGGSCGGGCGGGGS